MSNPDVTQQWRELQENYSNMTDDELEAITLEGYDLTDIAKQALQGEISRRQLPLELQLRAPDSETEEEEPPPKGYPPGFDPEDWGLIDFTPAKNLESARAMKRCFDDAGVPSYYGPDLVDDLRQITSPPRETIAVKVREVDRGRAYEVLRRCPPPPGEEQEQQEEEVADYGGHCPKCNSGDIVLESFDEASEQSGTAAKYHWSCDACGHQWQDEGIES